MTKEPCHCEHIALYKEIAAGFALAMTKEPCHCEHIALYKEIAAGFALAMTKEPCHCNPDISGEAISSAT